MRNFTVSDIVQLGKSQTEGASRDYVLSYLAPCPVSDILDLPALDPTTLPIGDELNPLDDSEYPLIAIYDNPCG